MREIILSHLVHTGQNGSNRQIEILPQVGEIWCIYKNWTSEWTPPRVDTCEFVIGEIVGRTEASIIIYLLTQLNGFRAVFMPDKQSAVMEIPTRDRLRFSHRIPSFLLTEERGGKLRGFYELDPASVPDVFLYRNTVMGWITYQRYRRGMRDLDYICQLLTVCKQRRKPTETLDWYGVLQVEATADDTTLKYQHDKLCLVAFILMKTLFLHTNLNISQTKGSKNFAFKLHEQAVPSRFLLASAAITELPVSLSTEHHVPIKLDIHGERNAEHEGDQQNYQKEAGVRTLNNPVIAYHYPDFCDIGKFRDINRIEVDQIWALYDDHDFIPRVYARIDHIDISNLKVQFTWLEHKAMNAQEAKWSDEELPVARGSFCLGETCIVEGLLELDTSAHLSSELDSTFLSIALTHYMSLDTRPNTEFTSCAHPVSEFHKSGYRFALNSNRRSNGWSRIHLSVAASLELETANPCVIQIGKLFFFPKVRFEPSTRTGHLIGLLPDSIAVLSMPLARSSGALKAAHTVFSSERLDGYIAVFKLHIGKEILEIPEKENLSASGRRGPPCAHICPPSAVDVFPAYASGRRREPPATDVLPIGTLGRSAVIDELLLAHGVGRREVVRHGDEEGAGDRDRAVGCTLRGRNGECVSQEMNARVGNAGTPTPSASTSFDCSRRRVQEGPHRPAARAGRTDELLPAQWTNNGTGTDRLTDVAEEAFSAREIVVKKLENRDFVGARKIAIKAQRLFPELENISQLLTVCEVLSSAEAKISGELDWYGVLQVDKMADETVIRKQYNILSYRLHPDNNTLFGAEAAFRFVSEAHAVLSDHAKRSLYDTKRQQTKQIGAKCKVQIHPKIGEVWAIYKNWSNKWVPSRSTRGTKYAIGKIVDSTEAFTLFVDGYISVFKPDVRRGILKIPVKENLRFSHRIPSFCLTKEKGGKLHDCYELDPAAVPDVFLHKN
uniref:J domain-containing protein n=1 Tax=Oryza barthii TaxID=65489 RepID=A0A0D3HN87_9ORYZ